MNSKFPLTRKDIIIRNSLATRTRSQLNNLPVSSGSQQRPNQSDEKENISRRSTRKRTVSRRLLFNSVNDYVLVSYWLHSTHNIGYTALSYVLYVYYAMQWCSPLEAPRGQKHKSWSWSWSWDKSLGLDLGLDKKVLSIFKPFSLLLMTKKSRHCYLSACHHLHV